jgi:hypothetical protein
MIEKNKHSLGHERQPVQQSTEGLDLERIELQIVDPLISALNDAPQGSRPVNWSEQAQPFAVNLLYRRLQQLPSDILAPTIISTYKQTSRYESIQSPQTTAAHTFLDRIINTPPTELNELERDLQIKYDKSYDNFVYYTDFETLTTQRDSFLKRREEHRQTLEELKQREFTERPTDETIATLWGTLTTTLAAEKDWERETQKKTHTEDGRKSEKNSHAKLAQDSQREIRVQTLITTVESLQQVPPQDLARVIYQQLTPSENTTIEEARENYEITYQLAKTISGFSSYADPAYREAVQPEWKQQLEQGSAAFRFIIQTIVADRDVPEQTKHRMEDPQYNGLYEREHKFSDLLIDVATVLLLTDPEQ